MNEKPEALRLADILQAQADRDYAFIDDFRYSAAAKLRSQHVENERLREALEIVLAADDDPKDSLTYLRSNTREVIKAALRREETT